MCILCNILCNMIWTLATCLLLFLCFLFCLFVVFHCIYVCMFIFFCYHKLVNKELYLGRAVRARPDLWLGTMAFCPPPSLEPPLTHIHGVPIHAAVSVLTSCQNLIMTAEISTLCDDGVTCLLINQPVVNTCDNGLQQRVCRSSCLWCFRFIPNWDDLVPESVRKVSVLFQHKV